MPAILVEGTVTDSGSDSIGATQALYVAWEVTVQGRRVRNPFAADTALLNGVGVLAFGTDLTGAGVISGIAWYPEIWLNWSPGIWTPNPTLVGTEFGWIVADHIRWSLSEGTTVHFYVFG